MAQMQRQNLTDVLRQNLVQVMRQSLTDVLRQNLAQMMRQLPVGLQKTTLRLADKFPAFQ